MQSAHDFICGCSSVVERQLPKLNVVGSSPIIRFLGKYTGQLTNKIGLLSTPREEGILFHTMARSFLGVDYRKNP